MDPDFRDLLQDLRLQGERVEQLTRDLDAARRDIDRMRLENAAEVDRLEADNAALSRTNHEAVETLRIRGESEAAALAKVERLRDAARQMGYDPAEWE